MLPARIRKEPKRSSRWRSPAHCTWIRGFKCCVCGSETNIAAAHVRLGSHTGMGQKPDDWRVVPLCDGQGVSATGKDGCHNLQHRWGEATFWRDRDVRQEVPDVEALIEAFCKSSPKAREIAQVRRERDER